MKNTLSGQSSYEYNHETSDITKNQLKELMNEEINKQLTKEMKDEIIAGLDTPEQRIATFRIDGHEIHDTRESTKIQEKIPEATVKQLVANMEDGYYIKAAA